MNAGILTGRTVDENHFADAIGGQLQRSLKNAIPVRRRSAQRIAVEDHRHAQPEAIDLLHRLRRSRSSPCAEIGAAAAIKMVRSLMTKDIEALTLECFLAAARAGVVDEVAASMKNNYPGVDWTKIVPYNLERMASHGERRAAEMEEVAGTLRELGVESLMTLATVRRQREMRQIGKPPTVRSALPEGRAAILNAISAAARDRN
jgi:hypothetical protein